MTVGREAEPVVVPGDPRGWIDHVIVCGLSDVGLRTIEQLDAIGAQVAVVDEDADARRLAILDSWSIPRINSAAHGGDALAAAGLDGASAVVCAGDSDLRTLETALAVRDQRPDVRIVVHLDNPAVGRAVSQVTGPGSVLDVAQLFAPSVIDRCLGRHSSTIRLGGVDFTVAELTARDDGTLRELYGALAPVGIVTADERIIIGPGRDEKVARGDSVTLLGTEADFAAAGVTAHQEAPRDVAAAWWRRVTRRVTRAATGIAAGTDHAVRVTLGIGLGLLIVSTIVLHLTYRLDDGSHMSVLNATYFTVETAATVGFGDFSFAHESPALQAYGIFLIVAGTAIVSTLFALVTNALVARRIEQSLGRGQVRHLKGHVVMVGLGAIGMRVLEGLRSQGADVVVIERDADNVSINQARALGTPVVVGDAKLALTLEAANLATASAVAIVTSNDLTNLETGLAVRDQLGERWFDVPVILRVFDRALGHRLEESFDFRHVWSTSALAAPWFVGAALGFGVLATFYVGNVPFLVARLTISGEGGLAGLRMRELGAGVRVIALHRAGAPESALEHPPRRDTTFAPGDDAYLAGPYEELLRVVARERR